MSKNADTKTRLIQTTAELIRRKGYFGTGVTEILRLSGVPKGSLYHHFPHGKDELVKESLIYSAKNFQTEMTEVTQNCSNHKEKFSAIINHYIDVLEQSDYVRSCPIATVALEIATEQDELSQVCNNIFTNLTRHLSTYFTESNKEEALYKGEVALSLIEGGLLLAKVKRNTSPLKTVEKELHAL
jgi:TetR/AcrR family transcriptional repressor of lmrAB and yxaGH operons